MVAEESINKSYLTRANIYKTNYSKPPSFTKNPEYVQSCELLDYFVPESGGKTAKPFFPCHYSNKSDKKNRVPRINTINGVKKLIIEKAPKWLYYFPKIVETIDTNTGECKQFVKIYHTDSHEASIRKKRKTIKSFIDTYSPLYHDKKVSCFFWTLTRLNHAKQDITNFIDSVKKRFARHGYPILGYIWVLEISDEGQGNHCHYHLIVATDRMELKGKKVPNWMKLKSLWGQRTDGSFIQKSVEQYCGKYISKKNAGRLIGWRHYGKSKTYEVPDNCKPSFTPIPDQEEYNPFYDIPDIEEKEWFDFDGDIQELLTRLGFTFSEIVEQWHNSS